MSNPAFGIALCVKISSARARLLWDGEENARQ
jgi:hypothetical protein